MGGRITTRARALTAALGLALGGLAPARVGHAAMLDPVTTAPRAGSQTPSAHTAASAPSQPAREAFALVTHRSTPATDVSLAQARRIFLGEQQFWPGGGRVVLFVHAPGARARGVVLQHLYQMSEGDFKRHWIAKTFRDHIASGPKIVSADGLAKRLTATVPGAVAVIPESEVDATVKVLTIDGRHPGDAGYPLVASAP